MTDGDRPTGCYWPRIRVTNSEGQVLWVDGIAIFPGETRELPAYTEFPLVITRRS